MVMILIIKKDEEQTSKVISLLQKVPGDEMEYWLMLESQLWVDYWPKGNQGKPVIARSL